MPLAPSRSSIDVPSYPWVQNRSMIRSSATLRSTSGRRPMPQFWCFETDRSTKNVTDQSHSGDDAGGHLQRAVEPDEDELVLVGPVGGTSAGAGEVVVVEDRDRVAVDDLDVLDGHEREAEERAEA